MLDVVSTQARDGKRDGQLYLMSVFLTPLLHCWSDLLIVSLLFFSMPSGKKFSTCFTWEITTLQLLYSLLNLRKQMGATRMHMGKVVLVG